MLILILKMFLTDRRKSDVWLCRKGTALGETVEFVFQHSSALGSVSLGRLPYFKLESLYLLPSFLKLWKNSLTLCN